MLSKKRRQIAETIGQATAYSEFTMALNPAFRGPNFTWDSLYPSSAKLAAIHIPLQGDFGKDLKTMQSIAAEASCYTLDACFKDSNIKFRLPI